MKNSRRFRLFQEYCGKGGLYLSGPPIPIQYSHFMQCCEIKAHGLREFSDFPSCGKQQVKEILCLFQPKLPLTLKFSLQTLAVLLE